MTLRTTFITGFCILTLLLLGQLAWAQQPVPVVAPVQPVAAGGGGLIVRPLWTEIVITVVMIGLALFAVGRSSNRS